ncbi:MAG: hypothetical protein R3254_05045, partial [Thiomicrorhabdus sp.]|nr:hypothetical protein [Thiomicrorhabdus sp.]
MSLIYNSLKQHEKTADASLKMNPISQRMQTAESQALSKRARGLLYLGAASFAIFGLFVLQVYWNESTHQSPQSSVNQLLLASATQASEQQKTQVVEASSKQNRSTQQSQELALAETEEVAVKQSVDKTSVASNEHLTAVMTVQEKDSTRPGNTLSETELTKVATTKGRVEAESQVVRAQEDVAIVRVTGNKDITGDSVVEKPHSPKKTVESATQRQ